MIKRKNSRMSDRANWGKEESSGGERDELIPRKKGPPDHHQEDNDHDDDDDDDEDDGIQRERPEQIRFPQISEHRRKEYDKEDKKQERFPGNRAKIRSNVNKILLLPVRQFNKHREGEKKKAANKRNISAPFPYDGEDFGGRPSCYNFAPSLHFKARTAEIMARPENSSYYYFSKSLIEKNDFYSSDCNVHREIPHSYSK